MEDFCASYRKLIVYNTVLCSKDANCKAQFDVLSKPISHILQVSSRRSPKSQDLDDDDDIPLPEELEELYQKLSDIDKMEKSSLHQGLADLTIAYIAGVIEGRMKKATKYCMACANIFDENVKITKSFLSSSNSVEKPCQDTFFICKQADRFMKLQVLNETFKFHTLYYAIFENIDISNTFKKTDFTGHEEHLLFFIRKIADIYIQIRGTYIARNTTFDNKSFRRSQLIKQIHFIGEQNKNKRNCPC